MSSEKEHYKIIYVDDNTTSLSTLKRRLDGHHEVYPAESAGVLFSALEKIAPDLILLDINMPGHDGYEIIGDLKKDERYANIPVIFITGKHDRKSVIKGFSLGAADYIVKPFETANLLECIEKHVHENKSSADKEDDKRPRILAVDDVASELRIIQTALHPKYKVHTMSRPESVIDFLKLRHPDLIILDYLMPVINGFELIEMIHKLPEFKNTPIIMLTAAGTVNQVKEAVSLGVCDFIVKPYKESELLEKVDKHIKSAK